ncbi:MAG: DUF4091 domain-containing protein [Planctomycetia bacterium]|nr:DUF4091 domain-containing protein [Planctomycetia bacterium]
MKKFSILPFLIGFLWCVSSFGEEIKKFDLAADAWCLNRGEGVKLEKAEGVEGTVLQLTSDGSYSSAWTLSNVPILPSSHGRVQVAQLRFKVRRLSGSGGAMTGFDFANFDIPVSDEWRETSFVFAIPDDQTTATIRLGQWMTSGTLQFAELELSYLKPFFQGGMGSDEAILIDSNVFRYTSAWGKSQGNFSRPLQSIKCGFNSNRWTFGKGSEIVFRFEPQGENQKFYAGSLNFNVGYHVDGTLSAEYSFDKENWTTLASLNRVGNAEGDFVVPAQGVENIWVRFRQNDNGGLQLYSMTFEARMEKDAAKDASNVPIGTQAAVLKGNTIFWELLSGDPNFPLPDEVLPKTKPGIQSIVKNIRWTNELGEEKVALVRCQYYVADFYREDFGFLLPSGETSCAFWWCDATRKVTQGRALPKETADALQLSAARNDYESLQLVVRPESEATLTKAYLSPLQNDEGNKIAPENVEIRAQYYHFIQNPTDSTGVSEYYPDALPPLELPAALHEKQNYPLWITIYVPNGTPAGEYRAQVELSFRVGSNEYTQRFPLALRVWNFDLPRRNHVETAFGYSEGTAHRYHGVKSEEDRRRVNDMYLTLMSKYRISPYNPVPRDGYRVEFVVDRENPENSHAKIDFSRFDDAMRQAAEKYAFTGLQLSMPGMGGGTFHDRYEPQISGFKEDTPEYKAMFRSMTTQIETHLRENGWLDMAYVYWFDEPDKKDYDFVRNGMVRIKRYAPGIPTMLTEEPSDEVLKDDALGPIDIWCPVTPNFDEETAKVCREKGARFWWYVCCWPHAPYCTEFIDHNAAEMRVWLWQTWKYDVSGILVWTTNWWTSDTAFPNSAQNPYEDPMSYVSGYSTPPGTRRFWGNGDGRFYYPPMSCALPSAEPNFDAPVPSIRLEMLREGIEDFEMLWLLRNLLEEKQDISPEKRAEFEALLQVPDEITKSMVEFTLVPEPIYERREKIAEAIEELSQ